MRLVVTGGRDYCDTARIWAALDELHARRPVSVLIEGEAPGLDTRARVWAKRKGIAVDPYPADWSIGLGAGLQRNEAMIYMGKPDFGLVFPGGRGTAHMRQCLIRAGIPFEDVAP
ncbi:hypothetical protein KNLIENLN_00032 [Sinorhizobium phage NV1.1.1]|nr:hypothetical protein KNLIENLN_00032 [Sinorhizobium phage NV1.1.1]